MNLKKVILNKKYICKLSFRLTAIAFSFLGFIGTFVSLADLVPAKWNVWFKLLFSFAIFCGIWIISFLCCALVFSCKNRISVFEANNGHHVYVEYGDILDDNILEDTSEKRNIVIAVNRCFDTMVDNDLVSNKSIHGIAFNKLYESRLYDSDTLNDCIQKDLIERQQLKPKDLQREEKRRGNLKRYDVGTVAEIKKSDVCKFFCLGLSYFDRDLTAHTSKDDYVLAMQKMIEYCYARSQGDAVIIPLIGAGLSKTKYGERAILEYLVKSLKLNKDFIVSDIYIVVRNSGKETIPITEL